MAVLITTSTNLNFRFIIKSTVRMISIFQRNRIFFTISQIYYDLYKVYSQDGSPSSYRMYCFMIGIIYFYIRLLYIIESILHRFEKWINILSAFYIFFYIRLFYYYFFGEICGHFWVFVGCSIWIYDFIIFNYFYIRCFRCVVGSYEDGLFFRFYIYVLILLL